MNDFVKNICLASFVSAVTSCYQVHPTKRWYIHTYLRLSFASVGATGRLLAKPHCCSQTCSKHYPNQCSDNVLLPLAFRSAHNIEQHRGYGSTLPPRNHISPTGIIYP